MTVEIVIPVLNEAARVARGIRTLQQSLPKVAGSAFQVTIADNGSSDETFQVAKQLAAAGSGIRVVRLEEPGRGRALRRVWGESEADILSYMDVDLSAGLEAFPALIAGLAAGDYDVATGSRLLADSRVTRSWKREVISRSYNLRVRGAFGTTFSDAQCGFKAITHQAARALLTLVEDTGWFLDTELLVLAEKRGYRVFDLPIRWVEDGDSRVRVFRTAIEDLKGLIRLKRRLARGGYDAHKLAPRAARTAAI